MRPPESVSYTHLIDADEIFMGSRGLGSVAALFMGSVATKVLHLTDLPVTLVK